jgi:hypothetical protein
VVLFFGAFLSYLLGFVGNTAVLTGLVSVNLVGMFFQAFYTFYLPLHHKKGKRVSSTLKNV